MPLPVAATINCAVATAAGALRLAGPIKDKTVLITGMGLLGLNAVAMCHNIGAAEIIAVDTDASRLETALRFGAHRSINTGKEYRQEELPGIDIALDMSGAPDAMEYGLEALAVGGTAVWVGAVFHTREIRVNAERMIRNVLTLKGLHNYNYEDLQTAVNFMTENGHKYPFDEIVAQEFTLENAEKAFEYALAHKPLRVGLRM